MKGNYVLLIQLNQEQNITIGRQALSFPRGYYAYIGSAMGGFESRFKHHLNYNKRLHWHIDYLLQRANLYGIILCETDDRAECAVAQALGHQFDFIPGFGSSDCQCRSHLFSAAGEMKTSILAILNRLNMNAEYKNVQQFNLASDRKSPLKISFPTLKEALVRVNK